MRQRGESYFRSGAVTILGEDEETVEALVIGTEAYVTTIWIEDPIEMNCSCPAFDRLGPCKHLWATILEVDQRSQDPRTPTWEARLGRLAPSPDPSPYDPWAEFGNPSRELRYHLEFKPSHRGKQLVLLPVEHKRLKNGEWGRAKTLQFWSLDPERQPDPADRFLLNLMANQGGHSGYFGDLRIDEHLGVFLLPKLCATGRAYLARQGEAEGPPLSWDGDEPWILNASRTVDDDAVVLDLELLRGEERMRVDEPDLTPEVPWMVARGRVMRYDARRSEGLLGQVRSEGPVRVPREQESSLDATLIRIGLPVLDDIITTREAPTPTPCLHVQPSPRGARRVSCVVEFLYGEFVVPADEPSRSLSTSDGLLVRDLEAEQDALRVFFATGAVPDVSGRDHANLAARDLPGLVAKMLAAGWEVYGDRHRYRNLTGTSLSVRSGKDWFDLEGSVHFGEVEVPFPALLAAAREGETTVELGDGSVGLLTEDWLTSWGLLDLAGGADDSTIRFSRQQAWILDALLADRDDVSTDAAFRRHRERLADFRGITPKREPKGFVGELRSYQRDALGWFEFLRQLGLGGCLADDMGLGKTVQVLALLEGRRRKGRTSIVVAPRSLIFNWLREAERFAPRLITMDFTGPDRHERLEAAGRVDLLVTTYGSLRRDVARMRERRFDYVVLDEAQAIKNEASQSAKAARVLEADHRLALSGTPIENHLGELWSLFEFLNPGMLGHSKAFRAVLAGEGDLSGLSRAIRPFVLRRTKEEVLHDLPEKTVQTLTCELEGAARREYDQLRDHYRASLLSRESSSGLGRMKIQVLEALLRLRQAACHPGLIDAARAGETSAKLEVMLPMIEELVASGHKAIVFSQFTKLLSIVRARLDESEIPYAYLDGRTRKREERVARFQDDPDCPLFLISLKAGGQGLNLTAADYVFLLDPWWNPAVEAQAIDRAHRIGRTRPVVAYRLITRETVEERVIELQAEKRALADAVLGEGTAVLKDMTRADLEMILS